MVSLGLIGGHFSRQFGGKSVHKYRPGTQASVIVLNLGKRAKWQTTSFCAFGNEEDRQVSPLGDAVHYGSSGWPSFKIRHVRP